MVEAWISIKWPLFLGQFSEKRVLRTIFWEESASHYFQNFSEICIFFDPMCTPSGELGQGQETSNRADIKICQSYNINLDIFLCDWRDIKIYYDKLLSQDLKLPLLVEAWISMKWPLFLREFSEKRVLRTIGVILWKFRSQPKVLN